MARKPLFTGKKGPVMAATWPFPDKNVLVEFQRRLSALGYDSYMHKRVDHNCYELVIGSKNDDPEVTTRTPTRDTKDLN